jgi:hypothetical protein
VLAVAQHFTFAATYHVRNREGGEGFWTRIGSAWAHKDGNGFNIQLETAPLDGRITLRVASEKCKQPQPGRVPPLAPFLKECFMENLTQQNSLGYVGISAV